MRKSSLIGHVMEILDSVRSTRQPADAFVKEFFRSRHYLGSRDRRFIADNVYGILRNYRLLEAFLHRAFSDLPGATSPQTLPSISLCMAYCVRVLNEDPATLTDDVSGFWRMTVTDIDCRSFLDTLSAVRLPDEILQDPVRRIAVQYSFPEPVVQEWMSRFGVDETENLCAASNQQAPITLRVNTLKCTVEECKAALQREGIETTRPRLSPFGLVLQHRINAQALTTFQQGWFELQDEGSQLLAMLAEPAPGSTILDACAGGGGKTLHLAALMRNRGTLVAVDIDERRLRAVEERARRAGVTIARIVHGDQEQAELEQWRSSADAVLVDSPCSGVGTYRRNPGAKLTFSEDVVERLSQTQQTILSRYSAMVKPGGRLVYATCSLLQRENEYCIESFLNLHPEFSLRSATGILKDQGVPLQESSSFLMLLPHRTGTDGYFAAVMTRSLK